MAFELPAIIYADSGLFVIPRRHSEQASKNVLLTLFFIFMSDHTDILLADII